jgi:hypothetical protein
VVTVGRTAILGVEDVVGITALGVRSAAFMLVNTLALLLTMCDMVRLTKEAKEVGFPASLPPFFMVDSSIKGLADNVYREQAFETLLRLSNNTRVIKIGVAKQILTLKGRAPIKVRQWE